MANEKKITKVEAFGIALEALDGVSFPRKAEVLDKIATEIANLEKKASKPSKATAGNVGLGELVLGYMAQHPNQLFTVSELVKNVPGLPEETSAPKMTAILRLDTVKPYVKNTKEKGKSYYQYDSTAVEDED